MKKLIYLIFLLNLKIYSQYGEVKYSIKFEVKDLKEPSATFQKRIKIINNYINSQTFKLDFDQNTSKFINNTLLEKTENSINKENKIASILTFNGVIYYDSKNKKVINKTESGVMTAEVMNDKLWEITNETKIIDVYKCYKAIKKISIVNRKGENKTQNIIAWFAPSLPYRFGPKNYVGLPGLVLELEESEKIIYYATSVKFSNKKIEIKLPKGKTISKEDYDKKLKVQMGL